MDRQPGDGRAGRTRERRIALTSVWPDIDGVVEPQDLELAARVLTVPLLSAADEELGETMAAAGPTAFDFLVAQGLVLKETVLAGRSAMELLGPGDVLAPPLTPEQQLDQRALSRYLAHGPVALAVLGERFREASRRWPGLSTLLHGRLGRQTHRASMHLAMLHHPNVEDRLLALFTDLVERFGHMTSDGAVVEVPLTHELIGRLVGARRPTVSLAVTALASRGALTRLETGAWRLARDAMTP